MAHLTVSVDSDIATIKHKDEILATTTIEIYGRLKTVRFNDAVYFIQKSSDWTLPMYLVEIADSVIDLIDTYHNHENKNWRLYNQLVDTLVEEMFQLNASNSSVPAGPNSSTFRSVLRGDIQKIKGERHGQSNYNNGVYFHSGVKIGTNHPAHKEVFNYMFILSSLFSDCCDYNNTDYKATPSVVYGTAFTAIGLG
jgi:hypothetical protein